MGEVNCRTRVSLEASLNACPNNFRDGERKKKPLLYYLLHFFPFKAITNRYVTPDSSSCLWKSGQIDFELCGITWEWGRGNEMFLCLPALIFCNFPQLLAAWMWVRKQDIVTWLYCYCSLVCKESWHGCSVSTVRWLLFNSLSFLKQLTYPIVGMCVSEQN